MPNNIAVSITADVAGLQANRAIASAELKALTKDLNDLAKTAKDGGLTDELRAKMLAAGDAVAKARAQVRLIDADLKAAGGAMAGLHGGTAGVTRELIVMGREAARGNFSRLAGSATILVQRLGLLTPAVLGAGAAIVAMAAPFAAMAAAAESNATDLAKFQNQVQLTGNYAGLTAQQYEDMARRVATASNVGIGSARNALLSLVASGRFTSDEVAQLGRDVGKMSQLTGQSAKDVLADFVKMADGPSRFAEEFNRVHHFVSAAQLEEIRLLEEHGQKSQATAVLVRDLTGWLDQQQAHMGPLAGAWHGLTTAMDNAWESFKKFSEAPKDASSATLLATAEGALKRLRAEGANGPGEGGLDRAHAIAELEREAASLRTKIAAENASAQATASAARVQAEGDEAYTKSHATFLSLKSSSEQARIAVKALNDEMAARLKANPNDAEAKDYMADKPKYDQALAHKVDPGDNKKAKAGPDVVSEWAEQLHAQQVASGEFFKDQTAMEKAWWESHLALTTSGSKDWLAVQAKIFEASKALAHQAYADQMATLNDQIEADKGSWAKEKADRIVQLEFIKETHGEESAEYKAHHKELEGAERQHQQKMGEVARAAATDQFNVLKAQLDANKAIRDENAKTAESGVQSGAKYNPVLGEVRAAQQIAALRRQATAQDLDDERQIQAAKTREMEAAIASYPKDSAEYVKAVKAKEASDQEWAQKLTVLANKAANQQIQDQQRISQAWHSTIDPMVSTIGNEMKGLIQGTESWKQALTHVADSALGMVIQALEKVVEKMIVNAIVGEASTKTAALGQIEAYAGVAGAAGTASWAGAPYPIDLGAPAFGAAMSGAAMAFGAFAQGTNVVPSDMIAQIHAGERIVPAADNRQMMAAINNGAAGGTGAGDGRRASGGGDAHYNITHAPTIHAHNAPNMKKIIQDGQSDLIAFIRTAHRNGSLKFG